MSQSHFNQVFLTQRVTLLRTLERMVNNHSTAEDLLQETYLRVTRALNERAIEHLEPFVFQTARNLALDHLRARRIQSRTVVEDVPMEVIEGVAFPSAPRRSPSSRAITGAFECEPEPVKRTSAADFHPQPSAWLQLSRDRR